MASAYRIGAWLMAALLALAAFDPSGSPANLASLAAIAIAVVAFWLWRPATGARSGVGRRVPVAAHLVGPLRSFDPDAAGRPRPRAPGA